MNKAHEACGSDEWRQAIREVILPWALGEADLGDNVLEVGPGYGATTDVLSQSVPRLTSVEIDDELAAMLTERFADVPSPVDPSWLPSRLAKAGFEHVEVRTNQSGWAAIARTAISGSVGPHG